MSLTIAIPTYNRADFLERLLGVLQSECATLEDEIEFLISDNASTDRTAEVLDAFKQIAPAARIIRNPGNLGAESNVLQCFVEARGKYVWVIGDDDRPVAGMVKAVLDLVKEKQPALIYIPSIWTGDIYAINDPAIHDFSYREMNATGFSGLVAYWFTFLSGMVIDKRAFSESTAAPDRFLHTNFPQLAWVYENLSRGQNFIAFRNPGVIATGGNSGSYAVLTAFGLALPNITQQVFGPRSEIYQRISSRTLIRFLPDLIWSLRFRGTHNFSDENPWPDLRRTFGRNAFFWLIVAPQFWLPRSLAAPFYILARLWARGGRIRDNLR